MRFNYMCRWAAIKHFATPEDAVAFAHKLQDDYGGDVHLELSINVRLEDQISRGRAAEARLAHTQEVAGSNPAPAT